MIQLKQPVLISKSLGLLLLVSVSLLTLTGCSTTSSNTMPNTPNQAQKQETNDDSSKPIVSEHTTNTTQTVDMKTFLKSKDILQFQGMINNKLGIHLELQVTSKPFSAFEENNFSSALLMNVDDKNFTTYEGHYYYDAHKENIRVEATLYSSGYISIAEFDKNNKFNGAFGGFTTDKSITGMWSDKDGKITYPFYIIEDGSQGAQNEVTLPKGRIGSYKRINSNASVGAYLTIYTEVAGKFKFNISGNWHDHTGLVDGVAVYTDQSRKTGVFHFTDGTAKGLDMTFVFDGSNIVVSANDAISGYGGANVTLVGSFEKLKRTHQSVVERVRENVS